LQVIFHDIADTYPTDADICCRYSLTDGVTVSHGDRIALYRVGWSSVQEHIAFEWVPVTDATELQVLFKGVLELVGKKGIVHPCTGTEALYRLYGP